MTHVFILLIQHEIPLIAPAPAAAAADQCPGDLLGVVAIFRHHVGLIQDRANSDKMYIKNHDVPVNMNI